MNKQGAIVADDTQDVSTKLLITADWKSSQDGLESY